MLIHAHNLCASSKWNLQTEQSNPTHFIACISEEKNQSLLHRITKNTEKMTTNKTLTNSDFLSMLHGWKENVLDGNNYFLSHWQTKCCRHSTLTPFKDNRKTSPSLSMCIDDVFKSLCEQVRLTVGTLKSRSDFTTSSATRMIGVKNAWLNLSIWTNASDSHILKMNSRVGVICFLKSQNAC